MVCENAKLRSKISRMVGAPAPAGKASEGGRVTHPSRRPPNFSWPAVSQQLKMTWPRLV
jgi:hypothetical protein